MSREELTSAAWKELQRKIGEGVGEASMCWETLENAGAFQTDRAGLVVDEIMAAVETYKKQWNNIAIAEGEENVARS